VSLPGLTFAGLDLAMMQDGGQCGMWETMMSDGEEQRTLIKFGTYQGEMVILDDFDAPDEDIIDMFENSNPLFGDGAIIDEAERAAVPKRGVTLR
jgi:hypothetical protein